ncbi:MAG: hypothetical protein ACRCW6_01795 [Mycoplasmoidaceae bacterium]
MKKINTKKIFSIATLSIFSVIPLFSTFSHNNNASIINYDSKKLETKKNSSPTIQKFTGNFFRRKSYLTWDTLKDKYGDYNEADPNNPIIQSPLSVNSINTVYNNQYFFNWIKRYDPKTNSIKINIVVVSSNLDMNYNHKPFILETDFDSIEDSAIWKSQCLILIGTKDGNKFIRTYQFENLYKYVNKESVKLVQKDSIKLNKYGSDYPSNIKYGLSPYNKTLSSNVNDFLLFPVGATASNYVNNKNSIFKHISINSEGKIDINNIGINFNIPTLARFSADDKILSVTVACPYGASKPIFYAYSVHDDENGIVTGIRFYSQGQSGTQNNQKVLDLDYIPSRKFTLPDYDSIVPYGMYRNSDMDINHRSFNIYWILQNSTVDYPSSDLKTPEQLIFSKSDYDGFSVMDPLYQNSGFEKVSGMPGNSQVVTINYGIAGDLDDKNPSYIAFTFRDGIALSGNNRLSICGGDIKLNSKDSILNTADLASWIKNTSTWLGKYTGNKSQPNTKMVSVVINNVFESIGWDPYDSSGNDLREQPFNIHYYSVDDIIYAPTGVGSTNLFKFNWTNHNVVLPSNKEDAKEYYPESTDPKDIFYKINQMQYKYRGDSNINIPNNSALWYSRNYATDLTDNQYKLLIGGTETNDFIMKLRANPSFIDRDGNEIFNSDDSIVPPNANTSVYGIVQPRPILFGWYAPPGEEINNYFTMYNNPGNDPPITIKGGFHFSFPDSNKIALDNFNSSGYYNRLLKTGKSIREKVIPGNQKTIGFDGSKDLIQLNYTDVNNYFAGIESHASDLNGTLNGKIYYWDNDDSLWSVDFSISGFISIVLIVSVVAGFIALLLIILLIIVLTKHFKNKKDSDKVRKSIRNIVINKLK